MLGFKEYEISNHLGNVLSTVSDLRFTTAVIVSQTDYMPFGNVMAGRVLGYSRYDFNGKETDTFTAWQDYGFRDYNVLYKRFDKIDPLTASYPWYTPYQFAGNKPIRYIDLDGAEEWDQMKKFMEEQGMAAIRFYDLHSDKIDGVLQIAGGGFMIKTGIGLSATGWGAGLGGSAIIYGTGMVGFGMAKFGNGFVEEKHKNNIVGNTQHYGHLLGRVAEGAGLEHGATVGYWTGSLFELTISAASARSALGSLRANITKTSKNYRDNTKLQLAKEFFKNADNSNLGRVSKMSKYLSAVPTLASIPAQTSTLIAGLGYDMFIAENSKEQIANLTSLESKIEFYKEKFKIIYEAKGVGGNIIWTGSTTISETKNKKP